MLIKLFVIFFLGLEISSKASQYAFLDEAFTHLPISSSLRQQPINQQPKVRTAKEFNRKESQEDRDAKLDGALINLSKIEDIYRFDQTILIQNGSAIPSTALDLSRINLEQALSLLPFYSENLSTRNHAFRTVIEEPLLKVLQDAAEASYKFPQTLKYLHNPSVTGKYQDLLDIAVRDLFANPAEGLSALSDALKGLKANKKLSPAEERKLRLFRNLAGFFYDRKALQYLRETNEKTLASRPDVTQNTGRVALLRAVQLPGEFFKLMLPSTLNLDSALPSDRLLEDLRDWLSHLSRMKFDKLFGSSPETTIVFESVLVDLSRLDASLKTMEAEYDAVTNRLSPAQLWDHIKSLPSAHTEAQSPTPWLGIESLTTLLAPPASSLNVASSVQSFDAEIDEFVPLPLDADDNRKYLQKKEGIYNVLNRKGGALEKIAEIQAALSKLGVAIDMAKTEELCKDLKEKQRDLSDLYKCGKKSEGEQKKEEIRKLINQNVLLYMGVTPEQDETYKERREIIGKSEEQRQSLRRLLDQIRPCRGLGNLSHKYEKFGDKLKGIGIILPKTVFEWNKNPETAFERAFHKVHRTGLTSTQDKNNLRRIRVESLLEVINLIRDQIGVGTSLEFESAKESHQTTIEGKAKIIADTIRTHPPQDKKDIDNLWEVHGKLYGLGSEVLTITKPEELNQPLMRVDSYIASFISQYEGLFPQALSAHQSPVISDLKQELLNKNRGLKVLQLRDFITKQRVQSNHRFHTPFRVEENLKQHLAEQASNLPVYEFLVSTFYELLKEVNDYPELSGLQDTDQIRNYFFHADPFASEPLIVKSAQAFDSGIYINNSEGTIAKELAILVINVRYLLEEFLKKVQ